MNFLNLEYFVAVAEERNFTAASKRLYTSQQSLSEHIKKLETEFGTALFFRSRPLALTPAGECVYKNAKDILAGRDKLYRELENMKSDKERRLTIAVATFDTPPFLPGLLREFATACPQYPVSIVKRMVSDISTHMDNVNLYISFLPLNDELAHTVIMDDCMAAAVHESLLTRTLGVSYDETLARLDETGDLSLLSGLPFIYLYDKQGNLSQDLNYLFTQYGFTPRMGFSSENADLNFSMCLSGIGVLLAPLDCLNKKLAQSTLKDTDSLRLFPVDARGLPVKLALSYTKKRKLTMAEKAFIEVTKRYLNPQ